MNNCSNEQFQMTYSLMITRAKYTYFDLVIMTRIIKFSSKLLLNYRVIKFKLKKSISLCWDKKYPVCHFIVQLTI